MSLSADRRSSCVASRLALSLLFGTAALVAFPPAPALAQEQTTGVTQSTGQKVQPAATGVVNLSDIAAREALNPPSPVQPSQTLLPPWSFPRFGGATSLPAGSAVPSGPSPAVPSPALPSPPPATTFVAQDDPFPGIIPPESTGAAGKTTLLSMTNDVFRVQDKSGVEIATGTLLSFWATVMPALHTRVVYPRVVYDAINDRWLVAAVSDDILAPSPFHVYDASVLVGVSQTDDPAGDYWLFRFDVDPTAFPSAPKLFATFPTLGFNKNWIAVGANLVTVAAAPAYAGSQAYVLDYPAARGGTATMTRFDFLGLNYAALQPAATQSATEETLYVLNYLGSGLPGTSLILPGGSTFSASASAAGKGPGKAFDGDLTTQWSSGGSPGQYIEIDFGAPTQFSGISALVSQATPGFTVHEVTLDGQPAFTWAVVTSNGQPLSHTFAAPQTAQKVRITTTYGPSPVAWSEIGFQTSAGPGTGFYGFGTVTGTPDVPVASTGIVKQLSALSDWTPPVGDMLPQKDTTTRIQADPSLLGNVVFRNGHIYFVQTVGLPVGAVERTAVQWVKVDTSGDFVDGGRIEDPTATPESYSYAFPSIAVNAQDDVLVGFNRFSVDTYASAAYAFRSHNDPAGTMRDPVVYKDGLGPYVKTYGSGQNPWGRYSLSSVDPTDDTTFWTVQEYAAASGSATDGDGKWGTWWAKIVNAPPTVTNVQISGNPWVGQTLTGSYTYGDADGDLEGTSTFRWLRNGSPIGGAMATTYVVVTADFGTSLTFEVTPVAQSGPSPGTPVVSSGLAIANGPPTATNVTITGTLKVGQTLTGSYTYVDPDGDPEGVSTFRWSRNGFPIPGATGLTYTTVSDDLGTVDPEKGFIQSQLSFEVTPVATSGPSPGNPAGAFVTLLNTAPTITAIADQVLRVNFSTGALPFLVGDLETPLAGLIVTGTSSDQTVVPDANIVLGGSGADRTVTVTPAAGKDGTATITLTVTDVAADLREGVAAPATTTTTFVVDVKALPYYMAEGVTGQFFDLELALANPTTGAAPVDILYLKKDGSTVSQSLTLDPQSRQTILVDTVPGLADVEVSSIVTSTSGVPLGVERTMTWDSTGYGSHTEKATQGAAPTWYFAEGSEQASFDTILSLANPQTTSNRATVVFLVEGGSPVTKVYDLLPTSRLSVNAGDVEEPAGTKALVDKAFGMVVTFDQPGVAERAMYFGTAPFWSAGHEAAGVNAPSTRWFHAEGATGAFFDTYILLSNPNPTPATVTLRFLLDTGTTVTKTKTVPANSRLTVGVEGEDPLLAAAALATEVTSDLPILSERAMYWAQYPNWYEAHDAFGLTATAPKWVLGEGRVGGPNAYETYILLANPGDAPATVTVTFLREGGLPPLTRTYVVGATSRFNVYSNGVPGLADENFGALIESTVPIAVERAMYSSSSSQPGVFWPAGSDASGAIIP